MTRRTLLGAASLAAIAMGQDKAMDLAGTWNGALEAGGTRLRLKLEITRASDGLYLGKLTSIDQGGSVIPIDKVEASGADVHLRLDAVNGDFKGAFDKSGDRLTGTWTQGGPTLPLEFTRGAAAPAETTAAKTPAVEADPLGLPFDVAIPCAPTPFEGGGKIHLAYELHLTNFGGDHLIESVEALDGSTRLASFKAAELNGILSRIGGSGEDNRALDRGRRVVVWMWATLDRGAEIPSRLRHRIASTGQIIEGGELVVARTKPLVLAPPLRGSNWVAANGPGNRSIHRRALIAVAGKARIAQRFAIDWVQVGDNGRTFEGDPKDNKNYHAYGNEALAVADAKVVAVKDGIPQNVPGINSRAVPITLETVAGNHIILDLGAGRYGFYAHLQPGSLRVKPGDRVHRGQALGLVGNTGNSTEPHLHFHVSDGESPLGSEGVPYVLESFDEMKKGAEPVARRHELPLQNMVVRFPQG